MKRRRHRVSIITCTNRPHFFTNILNNFKRQRYRSKKLIIVLNKNDMPLRKYRRRARRWRNVYVYKRPETVSLGSCLNYAIRRTNSPFIARFDDDDYYAPNYLREQMKALRRSGASIVGKRAHLLYLRGRKLLIMCNPGERNKLVDFVPGGTLLFNKRIFSRVRFPELSHGEDTLFLRSCRHLGYRIYSSSPNNFVGIRRKNKKSHTWKEKDSSVLRGSRIVAKTVRFRRFATRQ